MIELIRFVLTATVTLTLVVPILLLGYSYCIAKGAALGMNAAKRDIKVEKEELNGTKNT